MPNNSQVIRAVVVGGTNAAQNNSMPLQLSLVNPDGTVASTVKKQAAQADSVASTVGGVVTDFNALLAKLRLAGVIS
jgi:hypothetical protein